MRDFLFTFSLNTLAWVSLLTLVFKADWARANAVLPSRTTLVRGEHHPGSEIQVDSQSQSLTSKAARKSACQRKTISSAPQITSASTSSTNIHDCQNVASDLDHWTTSYGPGGAWAVLYCADAQHTTLSWERRQEAAPATPSTISSSPTKSQPVTTFTATCPTATAELWACFSSWEDYLNCTDRDSPMTTPPYSITDECEDGDYITATCAATGAAISGCFASILASTTTSILNLSLDTSTETKSPSPTFTTSLITSSSKSTTTEPSSISPTSIQQNSPTKVDPTTATMANHTPDSSTTSTFSTRTCQFIFGLRNGRHCG